MLKDKFYIGILKYGGEYYKGSHKLFISKQLFDKVQKQIDKIERPRQKGHNFPFFGLARCGECKAAIIAEQHIKKYKNGTKQTFIYYRCTKKLKPCTQKYIQEPDLESQIRKIISDVSLPQSWGKQWFEWLDRDEKQENIVKLNAEIEMLDKKLNLLLDSFLDLVLDNETYKNKKNEIFEQKLKIQEEISKIKTTGSAWLEPMKEFVDGALQAQKIARAKNTNEELAFFAKTVGSNFLLTDLQLFPTFNLGFAELYSQSLLQSPRTQALEKSLSVTPAGVEPAILGLKTRCPSPLDDGVKITSVSRLGFEPRTKNLKGSCSTTELPAHVLLKF